MSNFYCCYHPEVISILNLLKVLQQNLFIVDKYKNINILGKGVQGLGLTSINQLHLNHKLLWVGNMNPQYTLHPIPKLINCLTHTSNSLSLPHVIPQVGFGEGTLPLLCKDREVLLDKLSGWIKHF